MKINGLGRTATGILLGCGIFVSLTACGKKDDAKKLAGSLSDSSSLSESTSSVVEDALESAGGGEAASGAGASALTGPELNLDTSFNKVCAVAEDGSAVVTVTSSVSDSTTIDKTKFSLLRERSGSGEQKRTWSKAGTTFACQSNGREAQLNWADPVGLKLVLDVNRERSDKLTATNKVTGKVRESSRSFKATGSRTVEWISATSASGVIARTKSISSNVERKLTFLKSTGEETSLLLTVKTLPSAPLNVTVKRDAASPYAVKSKTINSGSIESLLPDGGKTTTTFSALVFDVSDAGVCTVSSGGTEVVITDASGNTQGKVTCTAADGAMSCVDAQNEVVEVAAPQCDGEDKQ